MMKIMLKIVSNKTVHQWHAENHIFLPAHPSLQWSGYHGLLGYWTRVNAALTEFILSCRGTCFKPQSVLFHSERKRSLPFFIATFLCVMAPACCYEVHFYQGLHSFARCCQGCVCVCACMHACVRACVWGWWDFGELQDKVLKISDQDCMVRGVHPQAWQVPSLGWACGATALSTSVFLSENYFNFPSWDNYYNYFQVIHTYTFLCTSSLSLSYTHIYNIWHGSTLVYQRVSHPQLHLIKVNILS